MTRNQISYWEYRERMRNNKAVEKETNRANLAREAETTRHNQVTEIEINRHNVATEVETNRHNVATEKETQRHNIQNELLTNAAQAESRRHNQANERLSILNYHEGKRQNLMNELMQRERNDISQAQVALAYRQLDEVQRHNIASEQVNLGTLLESAANHRALNILTQQRQDEVKRNNLANEQQAMLNWTVNLNRYKEDVRHNIAQESELIRSHKADETIKLIDTLSSAVERGTRSASNVVRTVGGL